MKYGDDAYTVSTGGSQSKSSRESSRKSLGFLTANDESAGGGNIGLSSTGSVPLFRPGIGSIGATTDNDSVGNLLLEPTNDKRTSRATKQMTINKLRFSSLGLIGRSEEVDRLEQCAKRVKESHDGRELVLISGESGTGKSALANCIQPKEQGTAKKGLFVSGKFDLLVRDKEPYAGITGACRELCGELLSLRGSSPERFQEISDKVIDELESELVTLTRIIPELDEVFSPSDELEQSLLSQQHVQRQQQPKLLSEAKRQISYAFRRLFQALGSFYSESMIVLTLDDLQWADFASIELLELLITDDKITNLLVVGCYRSDEVDEAHLLSQTIRDLHGKTSAGFLMAQIHVGNLEVPHVQELLMELLSRNEDDAELGNLAQICHRKTLGNVFFLTHYIGHLHDQRLLTYSLGTLQWTWDPQDVVSQTGATDNVIDLLQRKAENLPPNVGTLLAVLACLGAESPEPVVHLAWISYWKQQGASSLDDTDNSNNHTTAPPLDPLLQAAVEDGFLEEVTITTTTTFRFVHDKVQEAALVLVEPETLPHLKRTVGHIVLRELRKGTMAGHFLFVAVNLLNEGQATSASSQAIDNDATNTDAIELARLNLQAAQKAVESSAFAGASQYIRMGVELISDAKWSQQLYTLTLELFSLGAEVEASLGRIETMQAYCDEVLNQTDAPLADKFRVYNVLQDSLLNRNRQDEAVQLGLDVLKKLGYRFPKNSVSIQCSVIARVVKAQMGLKKVSPKAIEHLPFLADPPKLQAMQVLDKTSTACFTATDDKLSNLLPLIIVENYNLTLKHGLCQYSPPAFASFGLILAGVLGDFKGAAKISACIEVLMEQLQCRNTVARTSFILHCFMSPWIKPYQTLLKPSLRGYYVGLSTGDNEGAMWNCYDYIGIGLQCGKSIHLLEADCRIYIKQMIELNQLQIGTYTQILEQVLGELSGQSELQILLDVEAYSGFDKLKEQQQLMIETMKCHQSRLCAIFAEHSRGAEISMQRGDTFQQDAPGHFWNSCDPLYRGISLYQQARETKKCSFRQLAKKQHSIITTWAKKGNPNVTHSKYLLDAEHEALKGRNKKAEDLYQKAIATAARAGFVQDAALASERCAEFLLYQVKDKDGAAFRMKEAVRFYTEWGAHRKVEMMEKKHEDLMPKRPEDIVVVH